MPPTEESPPVTISALLGTGILNLHRSAGLGKALTDFPEINLFLVFLTLGIQLCTGEKLSVELPVGVLLPYGLDNTLGLIGGGLYF